MYYLHIKLSFLCPVGAITIHTCPLGAKYGKMGMGVKIFKENYG